MAGVSLLGSLRKAKVGARMDSSFFLIATVPNLSKDEGIKGAIPVRIRLVRNRPAACLTILQALIEIRIIGSAFVHGHQTRVIGSKYPIVPIGILNALVAVIPDLIRKLFDGCLFIDLFGSERRNGEKKG